MLRLKLPVPPSTNNAYANRKTGKGFGRVKTAAHRRWLANADAHYILQKLHWVDRVNVPYTCSILYPRSMVGDIDGRCKLLLDFMVSRDLTLDDRYCRRLLLDHGDWEEDICWIEVEAYAAKQYGEPWKALREDEPSALRNPA